MPLFLILMSASSCLCSAVAVNPKLEYAIVEVEPLNEPVLSSGETRKKRLGNVLKDEKKPFLVKKRLLGSDLEHYRLLAV